MTANRVYESMTRVAIGTLQGRIVIRVWRDEPRFTTGPDMEVCDHLVLLPHDCIDDSFDAYAQRIVEHLTTLPRIAAIEVLDANGNGGLFYPDWN